MMKKIKNTLEQLVGLELTRTTRAGATECIKFGILYGVVDRSGIERQIGKFGIHLQCPWRITQGDILLVGSDDVVEQPDETAEYDEFFDWDVQMGNLRDVRMANFLNSGKYIVESVDSDDFGGFELSVSVAQLHLHKPYPIINFFNLNTLLPEPTNKFKKQQNLT